MMGTFDKRSDVKFDELQNRIKDGNLVKMGGIAHEILNPISVVDVSTDLTITEVCEDIGKGEGKTRQYDTCELTHKQKWGLRHL